ncbi:alpha/beta fold hydrolase [Rhodobacter ferrooxidans]|uniref:Alpha/beta hydrolase fold protein n=1 Tax=Rhodobacter ferrooxidans TaxID=371731 RepID=C8S423_9RHOB|nr:alpha/beta fold hydrolase [Rhodobacter sp. SW2]EEW24285.1 alpha/beta hydrolase fold protein [Rhodobacter sp. SW2]
MTPDQIIATVLALLTAEPADKAFPVITAGGAMAEYPVTVEACPRPLPAAEVEGKTLICGRIDVPENHDKPDGPRIALSFAVLKAHTQSPAPDPLIYLHGGPGGGAVRDLAGIVVPIFEGHRARRDVVTFDQRAAGISSDMVTCFSTFEDSIVDLFQPATLGNKMEEIFAKCTGELKNNGRDLSAYNTVQNAKDVRAVMQALGYGTYNIYGISYGTKLALEVMRSAPEGVRSVVIDSVFPPNARAYDTNILPVQEGVQQVINQCAADTACAAAFPDLESTIQRVAVKLAKNPIPAARGRPEINVAALIKLFEDRNAFGHWPNTTGHIPLIVTEWDRGETGTYDLLSSGASARAADGGEMLKPFADKMAPDQTVIARMLLEGATAAKRDEMFKGYALASLSDSLAKSARDVTSLAKRLDKMMTDAMVATRSKEEMLRFASAYAALAHQTPERATLRALIVDHLSAADIDPTLALLDQLTDGDVAEVFAAVSKEARTLYKPIVDMLDLMVVACTEDIPFNTRETMQQVVDGLKFKFLAKSDNVDGSIYDLCPYIPPALPFPGFHDAVTSDIPTLVLYGFNDTQTSTEEALLAAEGLSRATALGFPEAGHAALVFSQCAKDIGLAFVERPGDALATDCIDMLRPKFILPKD